MIYQFVVSFVLGIIFESIFAGGWSVAVFFVLVSLAVFGVLFLDQEKNNFAKNFLLVGLALALGIFRMSLVDFSPDQNLSKLVGQKISFEAQIVAEPDIRDTSVRYTVKPEFSKNSSNISSLIILIANRFPELQYGDKIKVSGKLDLPKNFTNDNGTEFDYVSYLAKDKIHFLIYQPEIEKIADGGSKIITGLYSLKNIFIEKIAAVVPEPNASLLAGVIFGAKQSLGTDLLNAFKKVGLIHIVVLSGYNITIIAAGIFYLTSRFGKRNFGFLISIISIILFSIMVGFGATVIRAAIMATIAILARFLGRPSDALRWLFIAGFLMLLWNPLFLFDDPSFQLSFMATLGLILFTPFVQEKIYDPAANFLMKIKIPTSFIITAEKIGLREIISSTLAVQLFILPLLIKMSGQFSLISFLVNPIVLPLVPLTMALGGLTGGLGIIPFVGKFLSWPLGIFSYLFSQIIISITEFSARIPLVTFQIGTISLWLIFVWYLIYGFLFWKFKNKTLS